MRLRTHKEALEAIVAADEAKTYKRPYRLRAVILFTPRSGSSWLTSLLSSTGVFGFADEFANQELFPRFPVGARTEVDHLNATEEFFATPNGVYSIEVTYGDIERFETLDFFDHFKEARFFYLRRRNIISQAVSLALAVNSGVFHKTKSSDNGERAPADLTAAEINELVSATKRWCVHILNYETLTESQLLIRNLEPVRFFYEDLLVDPAAVTKLLLRSLAIDLPTGWSPSANQLRLSGQINLAISQKLYAYYPEFVLQLMKLRPSTYDPFNAARIRSSRLQQPVSK